MASFRLGSTLRPFHENAKRFDAYCKAHPDYAREAKALLSENLKASNLRKGAAKRALTHCKYGHPLSGDNLYLAPGRKKRKCWACIKRRDKSPKPPSQEQIRRVTAALNAGRTIGEICWGRVGDKKVGPSILTFRKLKLHRELNPDFDRFVVAAMADHNSKGQLRRYNRETTKEKKSDQDVVCVVINNGKPLPRLTDEKADRLLIGLREGRTPRSFYVTAAQLKAYCDAHPEYAKEALPLFETNAKAARLRKGTHNRSKTHCPNGHSYAVHGRVALQTGWVTRTCKICESKRSILGGIMKPDILVKIKSALKRGSTIGSITASGRSTRLIKHNALARHRRENPEFDRFVSELTKNNISRGRLLRWQRVRNVAVRKGTNDYWSIRSMLPANFPDKDDVVSAIFEDLLTGALKRENVKAHVHTYITAYNRMYPTKFAKFGGARLVSLDEVMFEDGSTTRGDNVSHGLWD